MACKLCRRKARKQIDKMIIEGATYREIQSKYRIKNASTIAYHKGTCLRLLHRKRGVYPDQRPW